jgi:hypothetical protein
VRNRRVRLAPLEPHSGFLGLRQCVTERARQRDMLTRSRKFRRRDLQRGKPQPIDEVRGRNDTAAKPTNS